MGTTLILSLLLALDAYVFVLTGNPINAVIPCPEQQCDFSALQKYLSDDTILVLDNLWSSRLQQNHLNVTEVYYCGNRLNIDIGISPCNLLHEQITFIILVIIPLLAVLIAYVDTKKSKTMNYELPKYEEIPTLSR